MTSKDRRRGGSRTAKVAGLGLFVATALVLAGAVAPDEAGVVPAFVVGGIVGVSMYLLAFWDEWRHPPRDP